EAKGPILDENINVNCRDEAHQEEVRAHMEGLEGVEVIEFVDRTFELHEGGKIEVLPLLPVGDKDDLSMAYTPGVARVCNEIAKDRSQAHHLTIKKNTVAIVTDGTAVLGLGDIGPEAALPVMEGKALLFKEFAGVDAFPVCLKVSGPDEIVETVERIAPVYGGINLEDIAAPACFEVEERLKNSLDIPVFHDDQHGTAVVVLAALENALKLTGKKMGDLSVVIAGVGAAGVAVTQMLMESGVQDVIGADRQGIIYAGRDNLNVAKEKFAKVTNPEKRQGSIRDAMEGADVFIGVSGPGIIEPDDLRRMADGPIVFALANPEPEIRPEQCEGIASVIATGRSDFPNQINNVLAFPGIFRGALDAGATTITENMKLAAADAIAAGVPADELSPTNIVPSVFDKHVVDLVAQAVAEAARKDGVIRKF
ncbi:MAG TPA: NADP-dependent malic enzyme, partial [Acidimicrobiales bacterium]|nr:NADP-dependent malic enzyme [Acidimicrobiales bacterium]